MGRYMVGTRRVEHSLWIRGQKMILKNRTAWAISIIVFMMLFCACGEDTASYQEETLSFETPVSLKKVKQKKNNELDLKEDETSNFHFRRIGAYVPWDPYPIWDYFRDPVPFLIPVAPGLDLVDYVHPFYAYASFFYPP